MYFDASTSFTHKLEKECGFYSDTLTQRIELVSLYQGFYHDRWSGRCREIAYYRNGQSFYDRQDESMTLEEFNL